MPALEEPKSLHMSLHRQLSAFLGVGVVATLTDYGTMIGLRQGFGIGPVVAALAGYCLGGIVSYLLNRRHTFATDRTHVEAGWRFAAVMAVGFTLTGIIMELLTNMLGAPYVPARIVTTGVVFVWNFIAHKLWTFGERPA